MMPEHNFQIRQLTDELQPPESGKQCVVLTDDDNAKVVLFSFAAGDGLTEHHMATKGIQMQTGNS